VQTPIDDALGLEKECASLANHSNQAAQETQIPFSGFGSKSDFVRHEAQTSCS
jgi:hypothetical protein